jgi:hypothetical protein
LRGDEWRKAEDAKQRRYQGDLHDILQRQPRG